jgi:hypothetical protein
MSRAIVAILSIAHKNKLVVFVLLQCSSRKIKIIIKQNVVEFSTNYCKICNLVVTHKTTFQTGFFIILMKCKFVGQAVGVILTFYKGSCLILSLVSCGVLGRTKE